jgi:hypothetical protein
LEFLGTEQFVPASSTLVIRSAAKAHSPSTPRSFGRFKKASQRSARTTYRAIAARFVLA